MRQANNGLNLSPIINILTQMQTIPLDLAFETSCERMTRDRKARLPVSSSSSTSRPKLVGRGLPSASIGKQKNKRRMAMDGGNPEDLAVGCMLSIRTTLGDEFEGQVITFDRPSNILVLQESSNTGPRRNIRLLKANYIKDFTFLGQSEDPLDPNSCFVDLTALQAREELALRFAFHIWI